MYHGMQSSGTLNALHTSPMAELFSLFQKMEYCYCIKTIHSHYSAGLLIWSLSNFYNNLHITEVIKTMPEHCRTSFLNIRTSIRTMR